MSRRNSDPAAPSAWPGPLLAAAFAGIYALLGLFRHWRFDSSAYDLGIFDQVVWRLSRFETPASSIRGVPNILGDHFHPLIALFAPLYWMVPAPETLIAGQAALLGLSVIPVHMYLQDRLAAGPAAALTVAYGLFWGLEQTAVFDFHETAFAPLIIATMILAADRRRWSLVWGSACALALVREDLIPLVGCFGLYLFLHRERSRGMALMASSVVAFWLVLRVLIPWFSPSSAFGYGGIYQAIIDRPWDIPLTLVTPIVKARTMALWFLPFAALPLGSPLSLLLVPFALSRFLSSSPTHWGTIFHYSAPLAPILAMAAGSALATHAGRITDPHRRDRTIGGLAAACVLLSAVLPGHQPHWRLFTPRHYRTPEAARAGHDVLALIPRDASVVAQAAIVPHLSERERVYVLDAMAPDADFVVVAPALSPWPLAAPADVERLKTERLARGYSVVVERDGWSLLTRK